MTPPRASRPTTGLVVTVVCSVAMVVTAFLPWASSGRATRTSFEVLRSAERLDLLTGVAHHALAVGWHLTPLAVAGAWLAAVLGSRLVAGTLAVLVAALGLALVVAIRASPLGIEVGAWGAVAAAVGMLAGNALMVFEHRRTR